MYTPKAHCKMSCLSDTHIVVVNETGYPVYIEPAFSSTFDEDRRIEANRVAEINDLSIAYDWKSECFLEVSAVVYIGDSSSSLRDRQGLRNAMASSATLHAFKLDSENRVQLVPVGTIKTESGFITVEASTSNTGDEIVLRIRYDPITRTGQLLLGFCVGILIIVVCVYGYLRLHHQINGWEALEMDRRYTLRYGSSIHHNK